MDYFDALMQQSHKGICPHFGICGGCTLQNLPYEEQLRKKEKVLADLFVPLGLSPMTLSSSPVVWEYRNRVDFNFGRRFYDTPPPRDFERETVLGFRAKNRWFHHLDIQQCQIAPSEMSSLLEAVRRWARNANLHGFDSRTHKGTLKLLLVREGKHTGERMVVLVTGEPITQLDSFRDTVLDVFPATSIHHAVSISPANVAYAEQTTLLYGKDWIKEEFHIPLTFGTRRIAVQVTPFAFLQSNTFAAEILYAIVRNWIESFAFTELYDLYAGNGALGLACSDVVERIVSVESMPDNITRRKEIALENNATNIEFINDKVENYLTAIVQSQMSITSDAVVVLDPPRAGLHPKALQHLLTLEPPYLIYISCKPEVLAKQDLPPLLTKYRILDREAVDMFPHTPHVELALLLKSKSADHEMPV